MNNEDSPPPAYSEQEFDRKIATALDVSLTVSPPSAIQPSEVWEEWNEAAFEAAARTISRKHNTNQMWPNRAEEGSSSQRTEGYRLENTGIGAKISMPASIEPLRIHKKSASTGKSGLSKTYFDGYQEDTSGTALAFPSRANFHADMSSQPSIDHPTPRLTHPTTQTISNNTPPVEEHDFSSPPPPFSPAEPNPDGTPIVIMSYNPSASPPPSPLISPPLTHSPLSNHRHQFSQVQLPYPQQNSAPYDDFALRHRSPRQSLPVPSRSSNNQLGKRPATTLGPKSVQASGTPRMNFDPFVAYDKQDGSPLPQPTQYTLPQVQSFSANAFYNSAVSAHLPTSHTTPAISGYSTSQQPSQNFYHPSSSYNSYTLQIEQPTLYGSALPVRGSPNSVDHRYQHSTSYTTPPHPAYSHR